MIYLVTNQQSMFNSVGYSLASIEESLEYLNTLDIIGFDTETMGMDPYNCQLLSMQLGDNDKQYVIDCTTVDPSEYKEILEKKELIMHNAKFDLRFLYYQGIMPIKVYDSFLMERVLHTGIDTVRKSLDAVTYKYCKIELDKTVRGHIHREGLSARVIKYAADDVKYLHEIRRKQIVALEEKGLKRTASLDNEFVKVLAYVEYCGFYMNPLDWQKKCDEDLKDLAAVTRKLNLFILDNAETYQHFIDTQLDMFSEGVKCRINWSSSQQVIPFMQSLGVDTKIKDKKSGIMKDSVDKKVLAG